MQCIRKFFGERIQKWGGMKGSPLGGCPNHNRRMRAKSWIIASPFDQLRAPLLEDFGVWLGSLSSEGLRVGMGVVRGTLRGAIR